MLTRITEPMALTLLAGGLLIGCAGAQKDTTDVYEMAEQVATAQEPPAQPVAILAVAQGNDPGLTRPMVRLVRNQDEMSALGARTMGEPDIDFTNQDVVIFALGEQPTAGYWAEITAIQRVGDDLYIQGVANAPGEDEIVAAVLTYPYCAVKIPKTGATSAYSDVTSVRGRKSAQ